METGENPVRVRRRKVHSIKFYPCRKGRNVIGKPEKTNLSTKSKYLLSYILSNTLRAPK